MNGKRTNRVGDILLRKGIVTAEDLDRVAEIQNGEDPKVRRPFGEILVQELGVEQSAVYEALAEMYGFRRLDITPDMLTDERIEFIRAMLDKLPEVNRQRFIDARVLPFECNGKQNDTLLIVLSNPTYSNISDLAVRLGFRNKYEAAYVAPNMLDVLVEKILPETTEFMEILEQGIEVIEAEGEERAEVDEAALDAEINQSMLTNLVEGMLVEAVRRGVSDIHIIPRGPTTTAIFFRQDGKLQLWYTQEGAKPESISAVMKDRSVNTDRFERDRSQDGFIQRKIDGHNIRYRVSIMPIVGQDFDRKFESIVIRILDDRKVIKDLEKLGLQTQARADFEKAIKSPQGMVILTGPTGSGKSTTLVAALYQVITPEVCVLTTEDPVEYIIEGARQLKISEKMTFELAIRGILRHDPDIVMVGEMRDYQTALTAIKMANTGHLTFSTLHTNDASSAVSRLFKMGVEPFLIANAINIIVAQRLIRTLCEKCKRPIEHIDPEYPISLGMEPEEVANTTFYEAVGCDACRNGYKGRAGIHEALYFHSDIKRIIVNAGEDVNEDAIRQAAIKNKMLTLRMSALGRVKDGRTTLEEAAAQTMEDEEVEEG